MQLQLRFQTLLSLVLIASSVITASADNHRNHCRDNDRLKFQPIPIPAGSTFLQPTAANANGWITGYQGDGTGLVEGFLLRGRHFTDASFPSSGTYTIESCFPFGITRRGVIAGMAFETTGPAHSYLRAGGTITELNYPGALPGTTFIRSMSSDGKVLGDATLSVEPYYINFIYKDGVYTPLSLPSNPPAPDIYWASINMNGHLLGVGNTDTGRIYVVAKNNRYKVLPALPGNYEANPVALLDDGTVVMDGADLDNFINGDVGYAYSGLVLRNGQWLEVNAPKDTLGITHLTGGVELSEDDDILLLGTYWDAATSRFKPFTATDRGGRRRD